jgi:hypothetical protein
MRNKIKRKSLAPPERTSDQKRLSALTKLGARTLAEKLVELAPFYAEVDEAIERLICPPEKRVQRFKQRLANLSCMEEFVYWHGRDVFARELRNLLEDLITSDAGGHIGFESVVSFFDAEDDILENCDDDGTVCEIFLTDAVKLLAHFGAQCDDEDWMCAELIRLYANDAYCVRRNIFDNAAEYLSETKVLELIVQLTSELEKESREYEKDRWSQAIESLSRKSKTPPKG